MPHAIQENLAFINQQIEQCERQYNREKGSVRLLAVSKGQPIEKIEKAYAAGQRRFGENYLQEALPKINALSKLPIEWHFIGPIQSNKIRKIAAHFDWVESIDAGGLAKHFNDERPHDLPPLQICIQVNIGDEKTKHGVKPEEVFSLAQYCLTLPRLNLRGLMTIPPPCEKFNEQRQAFHQLYKLQQQLKAQGIILDTLSMGMSADFAAAIAEGSTMIRIGTAIFGKRVVKRRELPL
ncbi:MAG: YggS family pyridoxal phosphate enzyme [Gammaproteobacteria bacterium RIFCSPHIGHO2_12_FULL_38_14]|nr:MAG: YggS family pyridoxal phosphate enzyme [Gammaproteobacteria bacterium RIFCSPHIGHO2_12_FULL_38_14]